MSSLAPLFRGERGSIGELSSWREPLTRNSLSRISTSPREERGEVGQAARPQFNSSLSRLSCPVAHRPPRPQNVGGVQALINSHGLAPTQRKRCGRRLSK